jgi:flagellar basal body-associated protein FliL
LVFFFFFFFFVVVVFFFFFVVFVVVVVFVFFYTVKREASKQENAISTDSPRSKRTNRTTHTLSLYAFPKGKRVILRITTERRNFSSQ